MSRQTSYCKLPCMPAEFIVCSMQITVVIEHCRLASLQIIPCRMLWHLKHIKMITDVYVGSVTMKRFSFLLYINNQQFTSPLKIWITVQELYLLSVSCYMEDLTKPQPVKIGGGEWAAEMDAYLVNRAFSCTDKLVTASFHACLQNLLFAVCKLL